MFVFSFYYDLYCYRKFIDMGFIDKDRIAIWGWVSSLCFEVLCVYICVQVCIPYYYVGTPFGMHTYLWEPTRNYGDLNLVPIRGNAVGRSGVGL